MPTSSFPSIQHTALRRWSVWPPPGKVLLEKEAGDRVKRSLSAFQRDYGSAVYLSTILTEQSNKGENTVFGAFQLILGKL